MEFVHVSVSGVTSPVPPLAAVPVPPRVEELRTAFDAVTLGTGTPPHVQAPRPVVPAPTPARAPAVDRFAPASVASLPSAGAQVILQRGNAQYFTDDHSAKKAARFWLRAYSLPHQDALREALSTAEGVQRDDEDRALTLLHLSCLQPEARAARADFVAAQRLHGGVRTAMSYLLVGASQDETYAPLYSRLYPTFAALRLPAKNDQLAMVKAWREGDEAGLAHAARKLEAQFDFLLAPKCALFLSAVTQFVEDEEPESAANAVAQMATDLFRFVYELDANGQQNAQGALDLGTHRDMWRDALEAAYYVEPSYFHLPQPEAPRPGGSTSGLFVMDLPWRVALRLPLSRSWAQEVAARQAGARPGPRTRTRSASFGA